VEKDGISASGLSYAYPGTPGVFFDFGDIEKA
jgi:hypothetical protein